MSECPNCGSAARKDRYYGKAEWACLSHGYGADYSPQTTEACQLIRSLREELAEARDAERDRIAQYVLHLCYIDLAKAIRNNEHRSDT